MSMEESRGRSFERGARTSRWNEPGEAKQFIPGIPSFLSAMIPYPEMEALLIRIRLEEIGYKIQNNQFDLDVERRNRSPSPTPIYDAHGKRLNTKDQRARDRLNHERQRLIARANELHPNFKPPADFKPFASRKSRKVYIPVKEYPDYNFIGLIIGPRGITQKTMEKETGAKIAIRGKGSVKDGRGKNSKFEDENDELHVLITSESEEAVIKAEGMVRKLLVPVEEGQNVHKRDQLRKLAELNGTLRDNMLWGPNPRNWSTPDVYCKYCGEISHPSSDCPNKKAPAANVDQEYLNFMASIEGGGEAAKQDASVEASYLDFMAALSGGKPGEGQPPQQQQPGGYQHDQYNPAQQQQPWGQQQQLPPQPSGGAPWQQQQHYGQQQQAPWQQPQQQGYGQWNNGYSGGGGGGGGGW